MLYTQPLHWLPTSAPGPLIIGCVGWFFKSVVGRILDSGCQLKVLVGVGGKPSSPSEGYLKKALQVGTLIL
jgi:hypothetical protein